MKQAVQTIKNMRGYADVVNNYDLEKRILRMLCFALLSLVVLYSVFLGRIVFNIIARQGYDSDARVLSTRVSNLELQYLSQSDKNDLNSAFALGFKQPSKISYAIRKPIVRISLRSSNEL